MNVQIFRHDKEWIVLTESYALTFHQTLAGAMDHTSTDRDWETGNTVF